jgi:hypothetical protein
MAREEEEQVKLCALVDPQDPEKTDFYYWCATHNEPAICTHPDQERYVCAVYGRIFGCLTHQAHSRVMGLKLHEKIMLAVTEDDHTELSKKVLRALVREAREAMDDHERLSRAYSILLNHEGVI